MRVAIAVVLIAAALWRAAADWQSTIAEGYAYRFGSVGDALGDVWPDGTLRLVGALQASGIPWLWDPLGALLLSIPVSATLAAVGVGLIATRQRARAR